MLENGWLKEVRALSHQKDFSWLAFAKQKGLIGYDCVESYIAQVPSCNSLPAGSSEGTDKHGESFEELCEQIERKTWQYARKQRSFWRSLKRDLLAEHVDCREVDLSFVDEHLHVKALAHELWHTLRVLRMD